MVLSRLQALGLTRLTALAGAGYQGPQIFLQSPTGPWKMLDQARFLTLFAAQFHNLRKYNWTQPYPAGLGTVLKKIIADSDIADLRWATYMLTTIQRECPGYIPIEEWKHGRGKKYGLPVKYTANDGTVHKDIYHGRGYVQLTWLENYAHMDENLELGEELEINAANALQPDVAYGVMSYGMRNGSFTTAHHKLADYITGDRCDYRSARRIINGTNHASEMAVCAAMIEGVLWLSTRAAFGTSIATGVAPR